MVSVVESNNCSGAGRVDVLKQALRGLTDKVVLEEEHHVNGKKEKENIPSRKQQSTRVL